MAAKHKATTSKAVMDYLQEHPNAGNTDVSKALGKKGIVVTPIRVANVKSKNRAWRNSVRMAAEQVAASRGVGVAEINLASFLLAMTGGVEGANAALTAANKAGASQGGDTSEVKLASFLLELTGGVEGARAALEAAREIREA
jgi:hypothetical protein